MSGQSGYDHIDDVSAGDIISLEIPDHAGRRQYKVVHKDSREAAGARSFIVTLEGDDGVTADVDLPAGTTVVRSLESKWESVQSPTPHEGGPQ